MGEKILKVAKNKDGYLVDIIDSIKGSKYYCPICGNILQRNFGKIKQYFSHKNGEGSECELKLDAIREYHTPLNDDIDTYLEQEYYGRDFSDIKVKLSNYKSEDGYYLTKEQYDIIHSDEDKIKISALAGSGKTETLYYYAKERPDKRILYIVYNKSMKDEADKTFGELPNVTVKTIHGLAFGFVGKFYRHKLTNKYGVVDIIKDLNLDWNKDIEIASKVDLLMMEYMLTDIEKFEDIDLLRDDPERNIILYFAEKLWGLKKEYKNNVRIEHDFYLKLYQLSKKDLSNQYDILLLDEAQDSNLIVFDIIKASNIDGVVIVGDQLQQIYGWRKSVNIMPLFDAAEYKLTTSFRVGQNIACLANILVQDLTKQNIGMTGFNSEQKIVTKINKNEPFVCLCRTNAYMFNEV